MRTFCPLERVATQKIIKNQKLLMPAMDPKQLLATGKNYPSQCQKFWANATACELI